VRNLASQRHKEYASALRPKQRAQKVRRDHYSTASEATGCHTQSWILKTALWSMASRRFAIDAWG